MIHNSFRRIALAQGLLPTRTEPSDLSEAARVGASNADTRRVAGRQEPAAAFQRASIDPPSHASEQQIQV